MRFIIILLFLSTVACAEIGGGRVVVLANSIDNSVAQDLYSFLEGKDCEVIKTDAKTFDVHKYSPFVIILGGHRAPEGVGEVAGSLLPETDKQALATEDTFRVFTKENAYSDKQKVFVFAGYEVEDTRRAWIENKDLLHKALVSSLLSTVLVHAPDSLIVSPKNNLLTYRFPLNVTNTGGLNVTNLMVEAFLNDGAGLVTEPVLFNLSAGKSQRILVELNPKNVTDGDTVSVKLGEAEVKVRLTVTEYDRSPRCIMCSR